MSVSGLEIFLVSVYPSYVSSEKDFVDRQIRAEIWLGMEGDGFFRIVVSFSSHIFKMLLYPFAVISDCTVLFTFWPLERSLQTFLLARTGP